MDETDITRIAILHANLEQMNRQIRTYEEDLEAGRPVSHSWRRRVEHARYKVSAEYNALCMKRNDEKRQYAIERRRLTPPMTGPSRVNNTTEAERKIHQETVAKLQANKLAVREKGEQIDEIKRFLKQKHPEIYEEVFQILLSVQHRIRGEEV